MPVLQAIAQMQGRVSLTLIGDNGTGQRHDEVMAFIRAHRLDDDVRVLGLLPPAELVHELPNHDVSVIPMVSGALPNKVFDSIAAGLPMLSLGAGDSSTLVQGEGLGWTCSFSGDDVVRTLEKITRDGVFEKSKAVLRHRSRYMHCNLFEQYEQVIKSVL